MIDEHDKQYLDSIKEEYPKVFKSCITIMKQNKGKRGRDIKLLSFKETYYALKAGLSVDIVNEFLQYPNFLKQLSKLKDITPILKYKDTFQSLESEDEMGNLAHWLISNINCDNDIIAQFMHFCGRSDDVTEDINCLDQSDFEFALKELKKYPTLTTKDRFRCMYRLTSFMTVLITLKKNKLDKTYLSGTLNYLDSEYKEMYAHVIKLYGNKFNDIMEFYKNHKDKYDFQASSLAIICPEMYDSDHPDTPKMYAEFDLAIMEIHYKRTGKILTSPELKRLTHMLTVDNMINLYNGENKQILLAFIMIGESLLTYADLKLDKEDLLVILDELIDYQTVFEECCKYPLISLKAPNLIDLREQIIKKAKRSNLQKKTS